MSARKPARTLFSLGLGLTVATSLLSIASPSAAQTRPRHTSGAAHASSNSDAGAGETNAGVHSATAEPGTFQGPQTSGGNANVGSGSTAQNGTQVSSDELRGNRGAATEPETGPIGPADVARLIQAQMPRLRLCYETARSTRPTLVGRVELRVTIGPDGHVTQASALGMPDAPEVADCLRTALMETTFPRPVSSPLQFSYPVTFVPEPAPPPRHGRGHGAQSARPARAPARH